MRIHELLEASLEYVSVEGVLGADPLAVRSHLQTLDENVDDAYFAHLWPLLVRHSCLRVELAADTLPTLNPIDAQVDTGALDYDENRQLFHHITEDDGGSPPIAATDLNGLVERHRGRIRLRCTDDEIYFRLTGSRKKIPKITPTIFTYLQLAARSRENGISALELGPMTDTTQNSAFHYIKVLVQLGLCAKIPASMHGSSTSVLVYRRFLEQNPHYRAHVARDSANREPLGTLPPAAISAQAAGEVDSEEAKAHGAAQDLGFNFAPFNELELVAGRIPKDRLIRVLHHPNLKNHMLGNHHLLQVIGWPDDTWQVRHRRQLQRHISSLIEDGIVEYVDIGTSARACLRLKKYNPDYVAPVKPEIETLAQVTGEDNNMATIYLADYEAPFQFDGGASSVKSIESQILGGIQTADVKGTTLADLCKDLSGMFKRTLEHVVNRHDLAYLPPHIQQHAIRCVIESHQRMRRLRVFTSDNYLQYMEQLGQPLDAQPRDPQQGHFADVSFRGFATSREAYFRHAAQLAAPVVPVGKATPGRPTKKLGRPKKSTPSTPRTSTPTAPRGGGRGGRGGSKTPASTRKTRAAKADDGAAEDGEENGEASASASVQAGAKAAPADVAVVEEAAVEVEGDGEENEASEATPRGRGRPPKTKTPKVPKYTNQAQERGRPRKYVYVVNTDGTRNRFIVGNLLNSPELPSVLIYAEGRMVLAPEGYSGVGPVPTLTREQIARGHTPDYYRQFALAKNKRARTSRKSRGKAKDGVEGDEGGEGGSGDEYDSEAEGDPSSPVAGPSKRLRLDASSQAPGEEEEAAMPEPDSEVRSTRRSTRARAASVEQETPTRPSKRARPRRSALLSAVDGQQPLYSEGSPPPPLSKRPKRVQEIIADADIDGPVIGQSTEPTAAPEPAEPETADDEDVEMEVEALVEPDGVVERERNAEPPVIEPVPEVEMATEAVVPEPAAEAQEEVPVTDPAAAVEPEALQVAESAVEAPVAETDAVPIAPEGEARPPAPVLAVEADEPLQEIKPERKPAPASRVVRVDIAVLRRGNEIYQCLLDNGSILSDQKLYVAQREWSHKYAGTDHPHAPEIAAAMDRKVFKRTVNDLITDGRIKERHASIPTTTGRWIKAQVLYVTGMEEGEISTYIRGLSNTITPNTPQPSARSKSALEYSAYRRTGPRTSTARLGSGTPGQSPAPSTPTAGPSGGALSQRDMFLNEPNMVAYLYGFQNGRCLRSKILHIALVEAFSANLESKSVVSRAPRIFALPFIFEDIRVRYYFQCVQVRHFDQDLYDWLQMPGNLDLRLRDMPKDLVEKAALTGRGSSGAKSIVRTLLAMLSFLQFIVPLAPCDEANAKVSVKDLLSGVDDLAFFDRTADTVPSTYFLIHDVAPIYHISDPALSLLGFKPAQTVEEVEQVWHTIKVSALETQAPQVARMEVPAFPGAPEVTGVLDMGIDHPRTLRGANRWRHDIRLVADQRVNLEACLDKTARTRLVNAAEAGKVAYDNALPLAFVNKYLDRRVKQMQAAAAMQAATVRPAVPTPKSKSEKLAAKNAANRVKEKEKRQKEKEAIRDELAARIRAAKEVYDERIRSAAAAAGVTVTQELLSYITHNRPMKRLGEIASDGELKAIIESYIRHKSGYAPVRHAKVVPAHKPAPVPKVKQKRPPKRENANGKLRRYRHHWTREDEDLFLDAEAVIRARCRGTHHRGRQAMIQIFPNIGDQVLRSKFKKLMELPGKEAYYGRLEDAWYDVWVEHRGQAELPDTNPGSHIDFDLQAHINFLRARINKNTLKLPLGSAPVARKEVPDLPLQPADFVKAYTWEYLKPINTSFDQLVESQAVAEDTRLHNVSLASIVGDTDMRFRSDVAPMTRRQGVIRSLLKMIVATPSETHSAMDAQRLLNGVKRSEYEPHIAALVNEGVLLKFPNVSGRAPGRAYAFTAAWLNASEGPLPPHMDEEVDRALERFENESHTTQWPIVGTPGDIGALMALVSNHQVDFDVDVNRMAILKTSRLTYNTRALNDDSFEFEFDVTRLQPKTTKQKSRGGPKRRPAAPIPSEFPRLSPWPESKVTVTAAEVEKVMDVITARGVEGATRGELEADSGLPLLKVDAVLSALAKEDKPRVFYTGYDAPRLVLKKYFFSWTAGVSPRIPHSAAPQPRTVYRCQTRKWVDMWGDVIPTEWRRAVKAAIGHVLLRPGLTEYTLRTRLSPIFDRLETCDILQYLVDAGLVSRRIHFETERQIPPVHATDSQEARFIVWRANEEALWV